MSDQDDFDGPAITRPRAQMEPTPRSEAKPAPSAIKLAAILVVVVLVAMAWMFRWEVTPAAGGASNSSTVYLLNRWTGSLYWVNANEKYEVKLEDKP
jgi:hypothetical protein